jgi:hypothetical protein
MLYNDIAGKLMMPGWMEASWAHALALVDMLHSQGEAR